MKKTTLFVTFLLLVLSLTIVPKSVLADEPKVVYFKENGCIVCKELEGTKNGTYTEANNYLKKIEDMGVELEVFILDSADEDEQRSANDHFAAYIISYGVEREDRYVPILFVGEEYYYGLDPIQELVDSDDFITAASTPLKEIVLVEGASYNQITGFVGFMTVLFAGLLDGFNPCAIALLLLFISLLGFSDNKKILILVSITYIFALFISYLLIGTLLHNLLARYASQVAVINTVVSWFIAILCFFLFAFNLYDYYVTKKQEYGKVKNQLPKWIQRFNKRIVKTFTNAINDTEDKKSLGVVLGLTFVLGITLSITELICTGQIYFGIIYGIQFLDSTYAYIALLAYNIMFVMPLIVIAVIAIRGNGIMAASNFIRERLHIIKLFNALLFLFIAAYYFYRLGIFGG